MIPEFVFVAFQATFAAITCGLIVGAFAERIKFSAVLVFSVLWFTFAYLPIAHMVWFWTGSGRDHGRGDARRRQPPSRLAVAKGALDFAGGTVVHINAGVAGLVGALVIGKRIGYGREAMAPHSLTMTMIGASLLWVGWFGFNAGSALEAGDVAALAFVNTLLATAAAAMLAWMFGEWIAKGKPSMLGAASGAVAGLVAITPACRLRRPDGRDRDRPARRRRLPVGRQRPQAHAGRRRLARRVRRPRRRRHPRRAADRRVRLAGLGGQGIFDYVTNKMSSSADSIVAPGRISAGEGVGTTIVWSAVVAFVAYKIVDMMIGLRVTEEEEREGLDITSHGETAYHA